MKRIAKPVVAAVVVLTAAGLASAGPTLGLDPLQRAPRPAARPAAGAQAKGARGAASSARPAGPSVLAGDPLVPVPGAPQQAIDDALYVVQPFFDASARIPRPYADARTRVAALAAQYPADPRLALKGAWLDERLGSFDAAAEGMERYATLARRSPNALRRLAAFYRGRGRAADEVRVLDETAQKLPAGERGPLYRRAIAALDTARPGGVSAEPYFAKIVEIEPNDTEALAGYVTLLVDAGDPARAIAVVDREASLPGYKTFAMRRALLSERARVYDALGQREKALGVYESRWDPLWPRAIAADYYGLLTRYGLYRERRRALQDQVGRGGAPLATVARLFNFYAYEGKLPAASSLLAAYEAGHASAAWPATDLDTVANLYAQIGDYDQASRYLYTLYMTGSVSPGAPDRKAALARLFGALVAAGDEPNRFAPGGLSLYRDVARVDSHPGALNGVLSLILAGNSPVREYDAEEARAAGYLNRALASSIYVAFGREYPASARYGEMTLQMMSAFADLGMDDRVVATANEFLGRSPNAPEYEAVALAAADAKVRLKDRAGERALILPLLDRVARAAAPGRPLLDRNTARLAYEPEETPVEDDLHGGTSDDQPPALLTAPNGRFVPESQAGEFAGTESAYKTDVYDPTNDGNSDSEYDESLPDTYLGSSEQEKVRPTYAQLLERALASFDADDKKTQALAFFWGELEKHKTDEGLHERFLAWLGTTTLYNDQLKSYRLALARYDDGTWLHRIARWYVRRGRGAEVRKLTDEVVRTLGDDDVAAYLEKYAGYGGRTVDDALDYDAAVALAVTKAAHDRFPNNPKIARMLLDLYEKKEAWAEWERLAREQYFSDPDVRAKLLQRLSKANRLDADYATARAKSDGGTSDGPSSALAYAAFAADAARWLSHHDEAVAAYRHLVELYPGERAYAEPLADLLRSFGSTDERLYAESAKVLDALAAVYPTDHRYPTRAGDALATAGDMAGAAERWRGLAAREPGAPATHLEVATLFWDYYQFDDAARELEALRAASKDRTLYAYRLGAIYDSKHDVARALPEYVRALGQPGGERDGAASRLSELAIRSGGLDKIKAAYASERAAAPENWQLTLGYADFLRAIDATSDAVAVLNREIDERHDAAFVEEARGRFRSWRSPGSEEHALRRLVEEARDERERMRSRLQLAEYLETAGKRDETVAIYDALVRDFPTNAGVLEDAARFYWRSGLRDKSTAIYRATIAKGSGDYPKRFAIDLARKQVAAGALADAEATLRSFYEANALDMDVFAALADVLGRENNQAGLADLYGSALRRVREAGLGEDDETARVADLRRGMIATLTTLNRFADAVDQHIEIVNRDPENTDALDAAFDYAARHDLTPRLVAYYQKLAGDSYKDYRWSLVLGRMDDRLGDVAGAAEAYRNSVANEPQRVDIRGLLADALSRAGRDEDAIAELRRAWELDGRDPSWLTRVARIQARQGKLDVAAATIDESIAARPELSPARLFDFAGLLAEWGAIDRGLALYDRAFDKAAATPEKSDLDATKIGAYTRTALRARPAADVFGRLEGTRAKLAAAANAPNNEHAGSATTLVETIDSVERSVFATAAVDFMSPAERAALDASVRRGALAAPTDERFLTIAQSANLVGAEEEIRMAEAAAGAADYATDKSKYERLRGALVALAEMYDRQARFRDAARALETFRDAKAVGAPLDYDRWIAEQYRFAGDTANEIATLTRLYESATGDTIFGENDQSAPIERLFELLAQTNQRDRWTALASRPSPYQVLLVNFLVERGDEELARRAIAATKASPAWVEARSAQVGLYFKDASPWVETSFRHVLAIHPIGELVGAKPDLNATLTGDDFFATARNYGMWLDAVANKPDAARDYIVGRVEGSPSDASAQAQLARFYVARGKAAQAEPYAALAVEIDPKDNDALAVRGEVFMAEGKRDEAIAAWRAIIAPKDAGSDEYRLYFHELADAGLAREALVDVRRVVALAAARNDFGSVAELVDDLATYGREHPDSLDDVADALYGAAIDAPEDVLVAGTILLTDSLPPGKRAEFYRLLTDRIEGQVNAQLADPNGESGYWRGENWIDPVAELDLWRKRNVDFLIETGAYAEAAKLLDSIVAEQLEARGTLRDDDDTTHDYSWVDLARATALLKAGDRAGAVAAVERYCAPASDSAGPDRDRCATAAMVLRAGGANDEADAMLERVYRTLLDGREFDTANFTGLAEVLYRRGRADEADAVLRRLATRPDGDEVERLTGAATAAGRAGRYPLAIELRESLARLARADAENAMELARLRIATGDAAAGAAGLVAVAADDRAANGTRAAAVDLVADLAAKDAGARGAIAAVKGTDEFSRTLAALAMKAGGDVAGARAALGALATGPNASAFAAIELGRLELGAGDAGRATSAFETALLWDESGDLASAIAFAGPTPGQALVSAYGSAGRLDAAIEVAKAVKLDGGSDSSDSSDDTSDDAYDTFAFEPYTAPPIPVAGLAPVDELASDARATAVEDTLGVLADQAARLERWDEAIAYARARADRLSGESGDAAARKKLEDLEARRREKSKQNANVLRVGEAVADRSVVIRDLHLD